MNFDAALGAVPAAALFADLLPERFDLGFVGTGAAIGAVIGGLLARLGCDLGWDLDVRRWTGSGAFFGGLGVLAAVLFNELGVH